MAAAHQTLKLITGWNVPLDLVEYIARILRVRALLRQSVTSGDLDSLLAFYEMAHSAAARGGLWVTPEYLAVLEHDVHQGEANDDAPSQQTDEGDSYER
jgi:hypothetical protein